jgi:hypothetical protein
LCLSRLDWPCLLPPALAAGRPSAPPLLVPAGFCWPLLAWTATVSLASGPLSDLLRGRRLLQQRYDAPTRACPRPAVCIHHQALGPCLGPIPSLSLALAPLLHHTARPRNSHTRPRLPAQASLVEFHAIDCHPLRPPRTCQLGPANRPPAKPPPTPPARHIHATSMPPTFLCLFIFPFSSNQIALPYRLAWKSSREMPLLSHMLLKIPPCSYSANGLSSSAICPASMTQMRS